MGDEAMIVAIVAIGCGTGIVCTFLSTVRAALSRRAVSGQNELVTELRALREEVRHMRQQQNDVLLALDSSLPRDPRLADLTPRQPVGETEAASRQLSSLRPG